jgi:hypothetical protein
MFGSLVIVSRWYQDNFTFDSMSVVLFKDRIKLHDVSEMI